MKCLLPRKTDENSGSLGLSSGIWFHPRLMMLCRHSDTLQLRGMSPTFPLWTCIMYNLTSSADFRSSCSLNISNSIIVKLKISAGKL